MTPMETPLEDAVFRAGLSKFFAAGYTGMLIVSHDHTPEPGGKQNFAYLMLGPGGSTLIDGREQAMEIWAELRAQIIGQQRQSSPPGEGTEEGGVA